MRNPRPIYLIYLTVSRKILFGISHVQKSNIEDYKEEGYKDIDISSKLLSHGSKGFYNIPLHCTYDKTLFPSHVKKTIYHNSDVTIMFKK